MNVQPGTPVTVRRTDSTYWTFTGNVVTTSADGDVVVVALNWVPGKPGLAFAASDLQIDCQACCDSQPGALAPRHLPSPRCESGGRPHCTCEVCF